MNAYDFYSRVVKITKRTSERSERGHEVGYSSGVNKNRTGELTMK